MVAVNASSTFHRRVVIFAVLALVAGLMTAGFGAPPAQACHDLYQCVDYEGPPHVGGILTGPGPGGGPHIKIFNTTGTLMAGRMAFSTAFRGGVFVGAADLNGDTKDGEDCSTVADGPCGANKDGETGFDDVIVGAGPGGGPHVRAFPVTSTDVDDLTIQGVAVSFFAYPAAFRGGVRVAGGDLDKDGFDEIVTGAGPGGGPHVKVFDARLPTATVKTQASFFAFSQAFDGGVYVATGHFDHDGDGSPGSYPEKAGGTPGDTDDGNEGIIIAGAGAGGASEMRLFGPTGKLLAAQHIFPSSQNPSGAVKVAGRDAGAKFNRVYTGTGANSDPLVMTHDWAGRPRTQFLAFGPGFRGGVNVGVLAAPGAGRLIVGAGAGGGPHVQTFMLDEFGTSLREASFMAYVRTFEGGVNVAGGEFIFDPEG